MSLQPETPLISVVIPNYNGAVCLEPCLRALNRQRYANFEVIVVDNASGDGSVEMTHREAPQARILQLRENLGFAAAVNRAIEAARGDWVAVLNNDTEAPEDWLAECAAAVARHPDASFLACRILEYNRPGNIFSAGDCFLRAGIGYRRGQEQADDGRFEAEVPIFAACGCAALYRKEAFMRHGGFDESFFAYLEDVDLGLRLQAAGARGYYIPRARVLHRGGSTSGGEFSPLAVRLRTRNAILLLLKSIPGPIVWRSLPMILIAQISWLGRVLAHGRLFSYLRGMAGVVPLIPVMFRHRRALRATWAESGDRLWRSIQESERMVRNDCWHQKSGASHFLTWYFRLF